MSNLSFPPYNVSIHILVIFSPFQHLFLSFFLFFLLCITIIYVAHIKVGFIYAFLIIHIEQCIQYIDGTHFFIDHH